MICAIGLKPDDEHMRHAQRLPGVTRFVERNRRNVDLNNPHHINAHRCGICFEDFVQGKDISELSCSGRHIFHTECLLRWVKVKTICPLCKEDIKE